MPWFSEQSDHITWQRLEELMEQAVTEARKRLAPKPKRVLLLQIGRASCRERV